jgi:hypothetical protein
LGGGGDQRYGQSKNGHRGIATSQTHDAILSAVGDTFLLRVTVLNWKTKVIFCLSRVFRPVPKTNKVQTIDAEEPLEGLAKCVWDQS